MEINEVQVRISALERLVSYTVYRSCRSVEWKFNRHISSFPVIFVSHDRREKRPQIRLEMMAAKQMSQSQNQ